jgi:hypothetical protein
MQGKLRILLRTPLTTLLRPWAHDTPQLVEAGIRLSCRWAARCEEDTWNWCPRSAHLRHHLQREAVGAYRVLDNRGSQDCSDALDAVVCGHHFLGSHVVPLEEEKNSCPVENRARVRSQALKQLWKDG